MVYWPRPDAVLPDDGPDGAAAVPLVRETVDLAIDGKRHPLDTRVVLIGRSQDCDIQLNDPNVSRRHAEIRQEEMSYSIVDLGSTNGLEVNGTRVRQAKLEDGDRIVIGSTEVVFERELP